MPRFQTSHLDGNEMPQCVENLEFGQATELHGQLRKLCKSVPLYAINAIRYYFNMIASFNCKVTEALFKRERAPRFANIERVARCKLEQLDWAGCIEDLRIPPGNRLEALTGNRKGQWSIRINNQWRVCFRFENGNALDVEIVDYH
jgi:proteic killer suppression protein